VSDEWVVPWAAWIWGWLFAAVLVFEIFTLYWNNKYGDGTQRANLTAYTKAFFGIGDRRLRRRLPRWVMVVFLLWLLLHFLEVIP
jgi:hypothetical protein